MILQEAQSARHGVEVLAVILDKYGAGDDYGYYNSILIGDTKEVWNFLIVSAHNYVAVKLPADKVSINPNIVTMDTYKKATLSPKSISGRPTAPTTGTDSIPGSGRASTT